MANLDSRFICTSDLELLMRDNSSGLPLSGGIVTFYSDINRTVLKPVYQLTGTPGNYSYAPLPNPCVLSSAGTFQDGLGNNIVPYYYPFMGTPEQNTGVQELYYIVVKNSGFVPQFIRQGWPQSAGSVTPPINDNEIDNLIPNGQFLSHNNWISLTEPPITQLTFAGPQTIDIQPIAQGGWYFAYTDGTNATFNNSFTPIPISGGWGINSFPKYVFNFVCTSIGNVPLTRDLWITWPDINKFSSGNPPGSTPYTLFFDAASNDMNAYTFTLYQIYYFGSDSPTDSFFSMPIATITIGPSTTLAPKNIQNITWLVNQGTIGPNGDDFVGFALRGPSSPWNVSFSDFVLAQGNETFTSFPVQTNDQMLSRGVAGFMPTPDPTGLDLYLPLILTPQGMTFDQSIVGQIIAKTQSNSNPVNNELPMDGTPYLTSDYSSLGIPYKRLANYLISNSPAITISQSGLTATISSNIIPMYGTGYNFVTLFLKSGSSTDFFVQINTGAAGGSASDVSTGWTFTGTVANTTYTVDVTGIPTAGQYWTFTDGLNGLVYNVWYSINGAGTAPSVPTGANIQVPLVTADTVATTINKTLQIINQYQFLLPNLAGLFLRAFDSNGLLDPDYNTRLIYGITFDTTPFTGANLASFEAQAFLQHTHAATTAFFESGAGSFSYASTGNSFNTQPATGNSSLGGDETRPVNFAVNFFIKY